MSQNLKLNLKFNWTEDNCDRIIKYLEDINKYNKPEYEYEPDYLGNDLGTSSWQLVCVDGTYEDNLRYLYADHERLMLKNTIKTIIKKIEDKKMKSLCRDISKFIMIEIRNEYDRMYYVEYLEKLKYVLGNYIKDEHKGTKNALQKTITDIKKFLKNKKLI